MIFWDPPIEPEAALWILATSANRDFTNEIATSELETSAGVGVLMGPIAEVGVGVGKDGGEEHEMRVASKTKVRRVASGFLTVPAHI